MSGQTTYLVIHEIHQADGVIRYVITEDLYEHGRCIRRLEHPVKENESVLEVVSRIHQLKPWSIRDNLMVVHYAGDVSERGRPRNDDQ